MPQTSITATIRKDAESLLPVEMDFLVDTGATVTLVPANVLNDLGIAATGEETVVLENGDKGVRKVAHVYLEIKSHGAVVPVAFGAERGRPRLAPAALEACGLQLDSAGRILPPPRGGRGLAGID